MPIWAGAVPAAWLHVLFWAGLRGAIAVALALSLPADLPQRALLQTIVFGIVLFTLLVQGTTGIAVVRRVRGHGDRSTARVRRRPIRRPSIGP